jgi:hypothetical protein
MALFFQIVRWMPDFSHNRSSLAGSKGTVDGYFTRILTLDTVWHSTSDDYFRFCWLQD